MKKTEVIPGCGIFEEDGFRVLRISWYSPWVWVWMLMVVFVISQQYVTGQFSFAFSAGAVILGCYVAACFLNSTEIKMRDELLLVENKPISLGGKRAIFPENIAEFTVCTHKYRGGRNYEIEVTLVNGRKVSLLRSIMSESQAEFVCDALRQYYLRPQL